MDQEASSRCSDEEMMLQEEVKQAGGTGSR
jgi:hypothetical protein